MGFKSLLKIREGREVTDGGRAFQTMGAARLKARSARIVLRQPIKKRYR